MKKKMCKHFLQKHGRQKNNKTDRRTGNKNIVTGQNEIVNVNMNENIALSQRATLSFVLSFLLTGSQFSWILLPAWKCVRFGRFSFAIAVSFLASFLQFKWLNHFRLDPSLRVIGVELKILLERVTGIKTRCHSTCDMFKQKHSGILCIMHLQDLLDMRHNAHIHKTYYTHTHDIVNISLHKRDILHTLYCTAMRYTWHYCTNETNHTWHTAYTHKRDTLPTHTNTAHTFPAHTRTAHTRTAHTRHCTQTKPTAHKMYFT